MADSSLSVIEEPWNTPSVMGITPEPKHESENRLPRGSDIFEKIMAEMLEEMELRRRGFSLNLSSLDGVEHRKGTSRTPNGLCSGLFQGTILKPSQRPKSDNLRTKKSVYINRIV
ncbi:hypothetical protein DPMN_081239 [Dreissena polymorpha]|uniref:Uncharacterized protein n=1 Tax=Dreissena polymorpha TaxID=45954 RepID=A0A9D4B913_DREPO|nr:hypothetical protein DPMN_081239 [Dreissena polymorpha]